MLVEFPGVFPFHLLFGASAALGQSAGDGAPASARVQTVSGCEEAPREDASASLCVPPSSEKESRAVEPVAPANIPLTIPTGTPLRIALDERVRIDHSGEPVHGKVVETVYAFDQEVIPAGSVATGHVKSIAPVSGVRRTMAYANGDLTPFHRYEVAFDMITLPDGRQLPISTAVMPGTAEVVHLVRQSCQAAGERRGWPGDGSCEERSERQIAEAKQQAHEGWQKLTAPGKMHRFKGICGGTVAVSAAIRTTGDAVVAELNAPLDFGVTTRTSEQLAAVGSEPVPDSTLKARLVAEVSSATATRGTPVTAILTEPLYSPTHQLILPANSRLVGEVVKAKAARKLHHNGELRVIFERIETSEEATQALAQLQMEAQSQAERSQATAQRSQPMVGNLEGVEVDKRANMQLDEEGGARTTDSKTRYLSSGLAVITGGCGFAYGSGTRHDRNGGAGRADGGGRIRISVDGSAIEFGGEVDSGVAGDWRLRCFDVDLREFSFARA